MVQYHSRGSYRYLYDEVLVVNLFSSPETPYEDNTTFSIPSDFESDILNR